MDLDAIVWYVAELGAICVVAMVFWLLGMRSKVPVLKTLGVAIGVIWLATIAVRIARNYPDWGEGDGYVTHASGPPRGVASVSHQFPFQVNADATVRIEMTAKSRSDTQAKGAIELVVVVIDPAGTRLFEERKVVTPNSGRNWNSLVRNFQPTISGAYEMAVTLPEPVSDVKIAVKEMH